MSDQGWPSLVPSTKGRATSSWVDIWHKKNLESKHKQIQQNLNTLNKQLFA